MRSAPRATRAPLPLLIGGTAAVALVVRVVAFRAHSPLLFGGSDNAWYEAVARSLARGDWGRLPLVGGGDAWSVRFPPAYPVVLAVGERLLFWVDPVSAHQWTSALLGALAAALVTLLAWRLTDSARPAFRAATAAVAGLLIACNPVVVGTSTSLMSEALLLPIVAATLLVCDRVLHGDAGRADTVVLGLLLATGALTRGEGFATLGAAVLVSCLVARRRRSTGAGARPFVVAFAIGVVVVLGWSIAASVAARRPVVVSTNSGSVLLGANCAESRTHGNLGSWTGTCREVDLDLSPATADAIAAQARAYDADPFHLPPTIGTAAEAEVGARQLRAAIDEITDDPLAAARAVPVRVARGLGLHWTDAQDHQEAFEGRDQAWEHRGRWFHLVLVLAPAVFAAVAIAWRGSRPGTAMRSLIDVRRLAPTGGLVATWLLVTMATYGSPRFRTTIEPALALVAALGAMTLVTLAAPHARRPLPTSGGAP